ncbi:MAG: tRNA pseudouridine(38-40) synthase TruA [Flavobacteriales bacterium]
MTRVFIELSYDGSDFHGWQRQPDRLTVQQVLEEQLQVFMAQPIPVMGCGRTDTGVHASYFVAHADWPENSPRTRQYRDWEDAVWKLNGMLPPDVALKRIVPVHPKAHARFDANERGYVYRMHFQKTPFLKGRSTRIYGATDFDRMQAACAYLVGKRDFASFCKLGSDQGTTMCDVRSAEMVKLNENEWQFVIRADRFLRNMVRAVIGTLLEIGQGKKEPEDMLQVIEALDRSVAGKSAPSDGLYLNEVNYPSSIWSYEPNVQRGSN